MIGRPSGRALLLGGVVAATAAAVGVAVLVLDSPAEARRQRLDERRVANLREIAGAIDVYWTREGALPPDLDALVGVRGLDAPRTDPVTDEPYDYRVAGERTYELCATFATVAPGREPRGYRQRQDSFWHHPAGEHCFEVEAEDVER